MEHLIAIPLIVILVSLCEQVYTLYAKKERRHIRGRFYVYFAKTKYPLLDHLYSFRIRFVAGQYRCYVVKQPEYRGRDLSHYMPHCWEEQNARYICWTGEIKKIPQAKTLCRMFANATQQFIDTGVPASGFER